MTCPLEVAHTGRLADDQSRRDLGPSIDRARSLEDLDSFGIDIRDDRVTRVNQRPGLGALHTLGGAVIAHARRSEQLAVR